LKKEYKLIQFGTQNRNVLRNKYPAFIEMLDENEELFKIGKIFFKISR